MKKLLLLIIMMTFPLSSFSEVTFETYCFTSGGAKPIKFEMRTYFDTFSKWTGGYVKYSNSKSVISIILKDTQNENLSVGRPDQTTRTWLEISNEKISGAYEMMSQGANVYSMTYINAATHKEFGFFLDPNVDLNSDMSCKW